MYDRNHHKIQRGGTTLRTVDVRVRISLSGCEKYRKTSHTIACDDGSLQFLNVMMRVLGVEGMGCNRVVGQSEQLAGMGIGYSTPTQNAQSAHMHHKARNKTDTATALCSMNAQRMSNIQWTHV